MSSLKLGSMERGKEDSKTYLDKPHKGESYALSEVFSNSTFWFYNRKDLNDKDLWLVCQTYFWLISLSPLKSSTQSLLNLPGLSPTQWMLYLKLRLVHS